jgi:hypothetical protein
MLRILASPRDEAQMQKLSQLVLLFSGFWRSDSVSSIPMKFNDLVRRRRTIVWRIAKSAFVNRGGLAVAIFLLCTVLLSAQDTPIGPEGTQVATEATPAAAVNTDALRNAAQNPVASLISVPLQENFNFGIGPTDRTQNVLNIQPVIPLSVSNDWNLIVRWITPVVYQPIPVAQPPGPPGQTTGVFGLGDMNPSFFLVPKKSKIIWGIGPTLGTANSNQYNSFGAGETQHGSVGGRGGAAATLDDRGSCKQHLVRSRSFQPRQTCCEPVPPSVVRQLQHEEGLVPHHLAHCHRQLKGNRQQRVDGAIRWRSGTNHEAGIPAGEHHRAVLWQRRPFTGNITVGHAVTVCAAVSKAKQGAGEGVAGAKTETDESGATTEVNGT